MKLSTLAAIVMLLATHGAVPLLEAPADAESPVEVTNTSTSVGELGGVLGELSVDTSDRADKTTTGRVGERGVSSPLLVQADDGERDYWFVYWGNVTTNNVYVSHVVVADGSSDTIEVVDVPDVRVWPSEGCSDACQRLKAIETLFRLAPPFSPFPAGGQR